RVRLHYSLSYSDSHVSSLSFSFFSSSLPPPPTSTLFPYTTLFRSLPGETVDATVRFPSDFPEEAKRGQSRDVRITLHEESRSERDRKSTRLNSSHVAISYAVFCLKKKKKQKNKK